MGIIKFLKPTKGKIILTIILILAAFGLWFLGIASIPMGGQTPFYAPILLFLLTFGIFPVNSFGYDHVLAVIIVYYIVSCLITSIYHRIR